jgi:hypothetical protein
MFSWFLFLLMSSIRDLQYRAPACARRPRTPLSVWHFSGSAPSPGLSVPMRNSARRTVCLHPGKMTHRPTSAVLFHDIIRNSRCQGKILIHPPGPVLPLGIADLSHSGYRIPIRVSPCAGAVAPAQAPVFRRKDLRNRVRVPVSLFRPRSASPR